MNMKISCRTVLWMFLLSGYLLANPIKIPLKDFGVQLLLTEVSCGNATFESPGNIQENCHAAALNTIKGGLRNATTQCEDKSRRITQTLRALGKISLSTTSSNCTWGTPKKFKEFVEDIQTFIQVINNGVSETTKRSQ